MNQDGFSVLNDVILTSGEAQDMQLYWASKEDLLTPEQAELARQTTPTNIPESWIIEAVQDALDSHIEPIMASVMNRLHVRCQLSGRNIDEDNP